MKKIILYICLISVLPMVSCKKYLEVEPTNVITLSTYEDVKALMGSYIRSFTTTSNTLAGAPIPYRTYQNHLFFAFYADDLDAKLFLNNAMARNQRTLFMECINWENREFPGTIWADYFGAIGFLNTIVDALEDVEVKTTEEKDIVRCEAKVLRAWYLFKLQQYFSPYGREDLGIPFNFDSKNLGNYDRGRKTQTRVYNTIISELKEVIECATPPRSTYNIWYDKKIANAILAQVYHFKAGSAAGSQSDCEDAITCAKAALEGSQIMSLNEYEPFFSFPRNTYGMFKDKPQALLVSATYNSWGMYASMNIKMPSGGDLPLFVSDDTYGIYSDNDVRKNKFFVSGRFNNIDGNAIRKYMDVTLTGAGAKGGGSGNLLIFNILPFADLHLIVAESYARLDDAPNARLWLENFQRDRYLNYTSYPGSDLLDEILRERRREFFLESDYRWCDLIRDNRAWERAGDTKPDTRIYKIEDGDFRFCLPIPLSQEMAHNKIQQNPDWGI